MVWGRFKCITFIVHFNLLPLLTEQELPVRGPEVGDLGSKRKEFKGR